MATPYVTGVVALIKQANPNLSVEAIENIIINTANSVVVIV
ncbi:MAG: S8 family serine peptidase [Trichodesmium sp. St19_bin1]|nr:S8 family serine peptidase [Trichodesmium sp. St19_bin1]